jgi:hypothetical protein
MYTYPGSDLDRPSKVLSLLGSLWTRVYAGTDFQRDRTRAKLELARQAHFNLLQASDCISRLLLPLYHYEYWVALPMLRSELTADAAVWHFDDPDLPDFDASPGFTFDTPIITGAVGMPKPEALADIRAIYSDITNPAAILHRDIDFVLDEIEGNIIFRSNPFDNEAFTREAIFEDGVVADERLTMWLFRPDWDKQFIYNHLGYVIGLNLPTSPGYKDSVNQVLDSLVRATSQVDVERLIGMGYGIPLVLEHRELVEDVRDDANETLVITETTAYGHGRDAEPRYEAGDEVTIGTSLTDAMTVYELRRGASIPEIPAIALPLGMLDPSIGGEITFENSQVPVTVTGTAGNERVEWQLGGSEEAIQRFWDLTHQKRLLYGYSLYDVLVAEYGSIPATINPMEFLIDNVLRNNCFVVVIQQRGIGEDALNTEIATLLRKILPPHTAVIIIIELPGFEGFVTLGEHDNSGLTMGIGMEPLSGTFGGTQSQINAW